VKAKGKEERKEKQGKRRAKVLKEYKSKKRNSQKQTKVGKGKQRGKPTQSDFITVAYIRNWNRFDKERQIESGD
jgi:hypothetical protein